MRARLRAGMRVELEPRYAWRWSNLPSTYGTVKQSRQGILRVLIDGESFPRSFHANYWREIQQRRDREIAGGRE